MPKKILVVDDNIEDLNTMSELLEEEGYHVVCAEHGESALRMVKKSSFHLILIDIMMPRISGYDLLRMIDNDSQREAKKAYVSILPKKEADLSHVDGFIQKPFEIDSFLSDVKKLIEA